ncbi:MAG: hypothetical protein QNJ29_09405 [Rhizobiaceae bacterium]|nr:hypothetical protein [Rhizobiaceae bacterium]
MEVLKENRRGALKHPVPWSMRAHNLIHFYYHYLYLLVIFYIVDFGGEWGIFNALTYAALVQMWNFIVPQLSIAINYRFAVILTAGVASFFLFAFYWSENIFLLFLTIFPMGYMHFIGIRIIEAEGLELPHLPTHSNFGIIANIASILSIFVLNQNVNTIIILIIFLFILLEVMFFEVDYIIEQRVYRLGNIGLNVPIDHLVFLVLPYATQIVSLTLFLSILDKLSVLSVAFFICSIFIPMIYQSYWQGQENTTWIERNAGLFGFFIICLSTLFPEPSVIVLSLSFALSTISMYDINLRLTKYLSPSPISWIFFGTIIAFATWALSLALA